jgi:phage-related protein (TIGR01555 family)
MTTKRATAAKTRKMTANQKLAALTSFMGRARMVQKMAGVQFGGKRDIYEAAGYKAQGQVKFGDYWALYTRGDIAGRIVDMPAKTTWRTPPEVVIKDQEKDGTKFTEAFADLAKRLKIWSYFQRADRLAGIGRYAVVVIGVKGVTDQQLKTPLKKVNGPDDIIYLSVYHEDNAKITKWVTDTGNERFGLPELYALQTSNNPAFSSGNAGTTGTELIVHATRLIHIAEDKLEDDVFGRPRLERCLNRLFDLEKVAASTGEAYWQLVARILQAKIDKEMEVGDEDLKKIDEQLAEMVHDLRRQFSGQGVNLEWLSSETPNVTQVADFYFSLIAGSAEIPKRILFGSEMGELASSTDQDTYFGRINERQEAFAEPEILRAFIDRMVSINALPKPEGGKAGKPGEYQVNWPPLYEEPDKDKAEVDAKRAQAAQALTPVGGNPRELVRITAEGRIELVEREPDPPMELQPPEPDTGAQGASDQKAIDDLNKQIDELTVSGADPEKLAKLKAQLKELQAQPKEKPAAPPGSPTPAQPAAGAPAA